MGIGGRIKAAMSALQGVEVKAPSRAFRAGQLVAGYSDTPQWSDWSTKKALAEGMESNPWVYRCIRKRMTAAASVPAKGQRWDGEGYVDEPNALSALLDRPNPEMDWSKLIEVIIGNLDAGGNALLYIVRGGRGGRVPLELWPLPGDSATPVVSSNGGEYISGYEVELQSGGRQRLSNDEVLHLAYTHPDDRLHGMSPLKAGGMAVDVDNESAAMQKVSLQNRGVPDGIFTLEGEVGVQEYHDAKRMVREQYSGRDAFREPWVVANAKWQQMSQSATELDLVNSRGMTAKQICAVFGVPAVLVGAGDDPTYSNYETARRVWWQDELVPFLQGLHSQMTRKLAPAFGANIRVVPDFTEVPAMRESLDDKVATAQRLWSMGVPLAQINDRMSMGFDLSDVVGAETPYLPSSVLPMTGTPEGGEEDDIPSMSGEQVQALSDVIVQYQRGDLTRAAAIAIIGASFPSLGADQAAEMIDGISEGGDDAPTGD